MAHEDELKTFPFHPEDFLVDEHVAKMTYVARGIYITLLCFAWKEYGLPDDFVAIAAMLALRPSWLHRHWSSIRPCFVKSHQTGRLINKRMELERVRGKQRLKARADFVQQRRELARAAAEKRWNNS